MSNLQSPHAIGTLRRGIMLLLAVLGAVSLMCIFVVEFLSSSDGVLLFGRYHLSAAPGASVVSSYQSVAAIVSLATCALVFALCVWVMPSRNRIARSIFVAVVSLVCFPGAYVLVSLTIGWHWAPGPWWIPFSLSVAAAAIGVTALDRLFVFGRDDSDASSRPIVTNTGPITPATAPRAGELFSHYFKGE